MKKLLVFLFVLSALTVSAQWTVRSVPNTRLESDYIHVSDPDGYLSDSTETVINDALSAIREQADVFVVTLYSIGDDEPKHFATALFNYWGIGDAETDNGVLLLFVEDQRALEFETGYGAESVLTDARCSQIFNGTIVRYFKEGDYEGGLCAGVADIVNVYGGEVPVGLMSNLSGRHVDYDDTDYGEDEDDSEDAMSAFGAFFFLLVLLPVPFISFFRWITGLAKKKNNGDELSGDIAVKRFRDIDYFDNPEVSGKFSAWTKKGFWRFLLYGVSLVVIYLLALDFVPGFLPEVTPSVQDSWVTGITLVVYLTLTCVVQNTVMLKKADAAARESSLPQAVYKRAKNDAHSVLMRCLAPWVGVFFGSAFRRRIHRSAYKCPTCGMPMDTDTGPELPESWKVQQEIKAYRYSAYRCASGHRFVERSHGSQYSKFSTCKHCGAHACKVISEKTLAEPTYTYSGTKEVTYSCMCCNSRYSITKTIPKLVERSSSDSSYSSSSSSSSGGSFGGGSSGGGGYSGRW